jgi:hypothetical protein
MTRNLNGIMRNVSRVYSLFLQVLVVNGWDFEVLLLIFISIIVGDSVSGNFEGPYPLEYAVISVPSRREGVDRAHVWVHLESDTMNGNRSIGMVRVPGYLERDQGRCCWSAYPEVNEGSDTAQEGAGRISNFLLREIAGRANRNIVRLLRSDHC